MPTISDISTVPYSGDLRVDSLLHLSAGWNYLLPTRTTLYYTFELSAIDAETAQAVTAFNASQKAAAAAILAHVSAATGITFAEVASGSQADFHFAACDLATTGLCQTEWSYSYTSGDVLTAYSAEAFIYLDNVEFAATNNAPAAGTSGYETLLHEIGHALGLDHPFDTPYPLPAAQDNTNNTVMSYTHSGANKTAFQAYDLLALQWIYGNDGLRGSYGYNSTFGPTLGGSSNSAPIAVADTFSTAEDASLSGNVQVNDSDPNGQAITSTVLTAPSHGSLAFQTNGQFTYTPQHNYNGADSFTYRLSDGSLTASTTVTLTVTPVNDAPVASNASITTDEDVPKSGTLPPATDIDGNPVTYAKATNPAHGAVAISGNGQYTYTPTANYLGADMFGFLVRDASGASNAYTMTVGIAGVVDEIHGTAGDDTLADLTGEARLFGLGGNDRLQGGSNNDLVDGGAGTDTAVYASTTTAYTVTRTSSGWRITDQNGADGVDTLAGVERLQFLDRTFDLVNLPRAVTPAYAQTNGFLFDAVFYLLDNTELVPTQSLASAVQHFFSSGAAQGKTPNSWFDASYYENRWTDLKAGNFDDATLFAHYNLYGVWEGRSAGPKFDQFDGNRYLRDNADVATYVDSHLADFLGSRSNGAIAHFVIYGANEGRAAFDLIGQSINLDYLIDLGG